MKIRYSKLAVIMLYKKSFMQLRNKNVKINDFNSCLKLFSVTSSFVTGNRHLFGKVPTNVFCNDFPAYLSSLVEISLWNLSPCLSLTAPRFGGKKFKRECEK
jgi:hypothetical protein